MRRASWGGALGLALLIGVVVLSALPGLHALPSGTSASAPTTRIAPAPFAPAPAASPSAHPSVALSSGVWASFAGPASPRPMDTCSGLPNWVSGSTYFFTDVDVCFAVPGDSSPPTSRSCPSRGTSPATRTAST